MKHVTIVLQARMGSTRLPGKVLADLSGKPMLEQVVDRVRRIRGATQVLIATSTDPRDEVLLELADKLGIGSHAGSESDVLDRYYQSAKKAKADVIVRVTADCPLIDPGVSGRVIDRFLNGGFDYVSNTNPPTYPDGLDTEVFSFAALERAWLEASLPSEREHVTPYIWKTPSIFRVGNVTSERDLSHLRWTVDHADDLAFVRAVYARMAERNMSTFGMDEVLLLLEEDSRLRAINADRTRNEGYAKSLSNEGVPSTEIPK